MPKLHSRFSFVVDGKVMGYYHLPFGLEFLKNPKLVQEDMLFDHSYGELTVLNAREKAKSKKLTVMGFEAEAEENVSAEGDGLDEYRDLDVADNSVNTRATVKTFVKKSPRNLPKFMQREKPETEEGIACENFRVFVKWALTLIGGNEKITEVGKPEFVCVNLPSDLDFVIDAANEEAEENGISFVQLPYDPENEEVFANLELYGGLVPNQINATNKF